MDREGERFRSRRSGLDSVSRAWFYFLSFVREKGKDLGDTVRLRRPMSD